MRAVRTVSLHGQVEGAQGVEAALANPRLDLHGMAHLDEIALADEVFLRLLIALRMWKHEHAREGTAARHAGREVGWQRGGDGVLPLLHPQLGCRGVERVPRAMPEDEGVPTIGYGRSAKEGDAVGDDLVIEGVGRCREVCNKTR